MNRLTTLPLHWLLPLIFLLIGLVYLYAAPNFEASDTIQHVGVVKWIADEGALPVQSADHAQLFGQEASQPPLYYLVAAALFRVMDTSDFEQRFLPSPFGIIGDPQRLGNRNLVIYPQVYPPDLQGSALALYLIRLLSLCLGAATVAAVYQSARTLLPGRLGFALLAASLTAFNPQFIFISASVSNDSLINMLAALITWQMLLMLRDGFQTRRSLLLALLIALASLTKLSGLTVGAVVGLAALWLVFRTRDYRGFLKLSAAVLACWLLIAGWWYLRNLTLYGELLGTATMLDNFGRRHATPWQLFTEEFQGLRISYWAIFGAFSILAHDLFYHAMDLLTLLGVGGLAVFVAKQFQSSGSGNDRSDSPAGETAQDFSQQRHRGHRDILKRLGKYALPSTPGAPHSRATMTAIGFLVIMLAFGALMLMWWSTQTWASTGRLLFPYITSASLLMALGLVSLRIPPLLVALPLLVFSLLAPFLYIIPNYDHPPRVDQLPESAISADVKWEDIRLTGYDIPPPQTWSAGDEIPVTLYWRAEAQSPLAYALVLSLLDGQGEVVTSFETWPGWGTMPHPWMELDKDYRDDYTMQIPDDAAGAAELWLEIRWYVFPDGPELDAVLESGKRLEALRLPLGRLAGS